MKTCPNCQNQVNDDVLFCENCGYRFPHKTNKNNKLPYLIGLVVIALIIGSVFYFTQPQKKSTKQSIPTQTEVPSQENNQPSTSNDNIGETPPQTIQPTIQSITASSVYYQKGYDYSPSNLNDSHFSTAWVEGKSDDGVGEYVMIQFTQECTLSSFLIVNGYCKSSDIYYKNNRVKDLKLSFSDGTSQTVTLTDIFSTYQKINLQQSHQTTYLKLQIESVYKGNKYHDTCLSEITFRS